MTLPRRADWSPPVLIAFLLAMVVVAATVSASVGAFQTQGEDEAAGGAKLRVAATTNEAAANFPEGITFSLTATTETPTERVELLYRAAGEETARMETPGFERGQAIMIEHAVDLRDGSLPPGIEVFYQWRLIDAAGAALETEEQTVPWVDDRFDWQPVSGERVTVYAYNGDANYTRGVLAAAERTIDRLAADYGATVNEPIRIWVYDTVEDFAAVLRPNTEPWVAGAAYPEHHLILAVLPASDAGEIGRIVPHEISHLVLHQATDNPFSEPPTWLDEGLAVAAQEIVFQADLDLVREAAADGELESIRVLSSPFPFDRQDARFAYAQSLSIVLFLRERYGNVGIARLIDVFSEGVTVEQAVEAALGVSLDDLDLAWRASIATDEVELPAGATVGDDESGGLDSRQALLLASGALIMGLAAVLAVVSGAVALSRARRGGDALDAEA